MRLRVGLVLATVAVVCVLCSIPASWYHVQVVGPHFAVSEAMEIPIDRAERRQIDGDFTLWDYSISNATFTDQLPDPPDPSEYQDPMWVSDFSEEDVVIPNENTVAVYEETTLLIGTSVFIMALGAFGAWNIARYDRYRMFTAASFVLAAVLLFGACYYFGQELPGAMEADSATGMEESFGLAFEPYIDPLGDPGYYYEFSGGYPNQDPRAGEQLSYGPESGWWLAGTGALFSILAGAMLVGAPMWAPLKRRQPATREVVRFVPVPHMANTRQRRLYPRRMPGVSGSSPGQPRRVDRTHLPKR